ncbi:hypothetical protein [Pseudochryseolinea flava]|uniref:hypothetical protein n=1 Tax=Pseudochryseolinea flava TaxID=2059302 RepID=UPI001057D196|nr:hypothetical protein [Pseudochryseolinea flava]
MNNRCNHKVLFHVLVMAIVMCLPVLVQAQPGDPDPPGDPVPFTGIEWLIAAGGALGGYNIFRRNRKQKD